MQQAVYESDINEGNDLPYYCRSCHIRRNQLGMPNWHEWLELVYVTRGECGIWLKGRRYLLKKGDAAVADSEVIHTVSSCGNDADFILLHIKSSFFKENGLELSHLHFSEYIDGDAALDPLVGSVLTLNASTDGDPFKNARIRKALLELILYLADHHRENSEPGPAGGAFLRVREAMRHIRAQLSTALTLDGIAATVNINKYQLEKDFKAVAGMTVFAFINTVRCEEAKRMIFAGASVGEAAFACGFGNLSYFSRTYQKMTGELPNVTKRRAKG